MTITNEQRPLKLGILGGTFDPPHKSHVELCRYASDSLGLDGIVVVPTGSHPFKSGETDKSDRYNMAMLAFDGMKGYSVSDIEIAREGMSYTIDTLTELSRIWPGVEFYFIIGSDILREAHLWRDFLAVSKLTRFICCPRAGDSREMILLTAEKLSRNFYSKIIVLDTLMPEGLSSTQARKGIMEYRDELDEKVWEYINQKGLYGQRNQ
ncbi:MAG: nicotinate (nicotinamide) nucleotide adenylyltransferase [Eubacteriaceae bacterium]|nr:nicotinate (nicotinamide) nucleotide adenylyltransferase [Eubacteriaceae bacterium]